MKNEEKITDVMKNEEKITDVQIDETVKRVEDLHNKRVELNSLNEELGVYQKDLTNAETVFGVSSKEYSLKKQLVDSTVSRIDNVKEEIKKLSFKKSELKPAFDALTKKFEEAYRNDTVKEYHIEMSPKQEGKEVEPQKGKKVFKQLLDYLNHNVSFTAKSAVNLMLLIRNMEENKAWVNSKEFDNVIILRSTNVLGLWKCIMEDFTGKGFYEARTFLECWANCGQSISDAVRQIQKDNAITRQIGTNLNVVEDEYNLSENDIVENEEPVSTKDEVDPEVE